LVLAPVEGGAAIAAKPQATHTNASKVWVGTDRSGRETRKGGAGMALEFISSSVSIIALLVSLFTLWFTVIRRGNVCSTHPSFIAFRYDFVGKEIPQAKIFFRSLLYSTGKRGQVIESLFLRLTEGRGEPSFRFGATSTKSWSEVVVYLSQRQGSPPITILTLLSLTNYFSFRGARIRWSLSRSWSGVDVLSRSGQ
jgi:hypothetical protein